MGILQQAHSGNMSGSNSNTKCKRALSSVFTGWTQSPKSAAHRSRLGLIYQRKGAPPEPSIADKGQWSNMKS